MATVADPAQDEQHLVELGSRIRFRRLRLAMTQAQLAAMVGLTRTSISNVEVGRQRLPYLTVRAIAKALHTTVAALIGDEPPREIPVVVVRTRPAVWCSLCGGLGEYESTAAAEEQRLRHIAGHGRDSGTLV